MLVRQQFHESKMKLVNGLTEFSMKALIIAAGLGKRLKSQTITTPKALLNVGGVTILDRMIRSLNNCGVTEIGLVRGYLAEKFKAYSIKYFENPDFKENNILHSLMCARDFLIDSANDGEPLLLTYSDIVVDKSWIEYASTMSADIALICDSNWKQRYIGRDQHPVTEAELVVFDQEHVLLQIGKIYDYVDDIGHGSSQNIAEFIGICFLSPKGILKVLNAFDELNRCLKPTDPFGNSSEFRKAYLSDLFQFMSNAGEQIFVATGGYTWFEIDTEQDLERANNYFSKRL